MLSESSVRIRRADGCLSLLAGSGPARSRRGGLWIVAVGRPTRWVVKDVFANLQQGLVAAHDVLVVVALPQSFGERLPVPASYRSDVVDRREGFVCADYIAQANPCWRCAVGGVLLAGTHKGRPYGRLAGCGGILLAGTHKGRPYGRLAGCGGILLAGTHKGRPYRRLAGCDGILPTGTHKGRPYRGLAGRCGIWGLGTHTGRPDRNAGALVGGGGGCGVCRWRPVDEDDAVEMVWHNNECVRLNRRKALGQFLPDPADHPARLVQAHPFVADLAE